MAHLRGDRPFASIHKILKMLLSPHSSHKPANQDTDMAEDVDEPPDQRFLSSSHMHADDDDTVVYVKSPAVAKDQKESLLTRALKSSPELEASHRHHPSAYDHSLSYRSYPHSNVSGVSTAELTSDGGMTSPSLSTTSSPPLPSQMTRKPASNNKEGNSQSVADSNESTVEANLGRKRCISFACGRKTEGQQKPQSQQQQQPQVPTSQQKPTAQNTTAQVAPAEPVKRKTVLTFVCPARDANPPRERSPVRKESQRSRLRGSPAPVARKASPPEKEEPAPVSISQPQQQQKPSSPNERRGIPTWGLGKFEESEETRFHEFASSVEEDDDWVAKAAEYTEKITMNDCMKKENAIRKLGEEAEQEALDDEDDDDDEDDEDDDSADDDEDEDDEDDISTVHDLDVDDGNESDNEAGFADSDESDGGSDYGFWAPTSTTAATSPQTIDVPHPTIERRLSTASYDSPHDNDPQNWPPALTGKHMPGRRSSKTSKTRPGTPNLPDSTDFVCGTLDEDRPLEAAYKSCMEQRRLSKQVVIPQDIDPSFPTSDPEDEDDDDDDDDEEDEVDDEVPVPDEAARGRSGGPQARKPSPHPSPPKRMVSPPPRRQGRSSPKRLRSPPPPMKFKLPSKVEEQGDDSVGIPVLHPQGLNISELVQRPSVTRTKSLPRTPNPFFASLEQLPRRSTFGSQAGDSSEREMHTRGPVDIVEGLEKKRQKRKEKFWRQHCRKAAKEQTNRRPTRGKGAERMKELGLEAAERCRAYGVGEDAQLVLSV